jgi:hypothetical protein
MFAGNAAMKNVVRRQSEGYINIETQIGANAQNVLENEL